MLHDLGLQELQRVFALLLGDVAHHHRVHLLGENPDVDAHGDGLVDRQCSIDLIEHAQVLQQLSALVLLLAELFEEVFAREDKLFESSGFGRVRSELGAVDHRRGPRRLHPLLGVLKLRDVLPEKPDSAGAGFHEFESGRYEIVRSSALNTDLEACLPVHVVDPAIEGRRRGGATLFGEPGLGLGGAPLTDHDPLPKTLFDVLRRR